MRRGGRAGAWATAVLALTVTVACTPSDAEPTSPPTSGPPTATKSATPAATPSPTPTTDAERAAERAEALIREYYATTDAIGTDPAADLAQLGNIAISKDLAALEALYADWRANGWVQHGELRVLAVDTVSVNLDNSDPTVGRVPSVEIEVCYDVTDVDVVDGTGASVVTDDRPDRLWVRHVVANYSWDTEPETAWRVASSVDLPEKTPCDPAR